MGPKCKKRTRSSSTRKSSRRTLHKKPAHQPKIAESPAAVLQPCAATTTKAASDNTLLILDHGVDFGMMQMDTSDYCSPCATPRAEKSRIPEIKTCPPAPKKRRALSFSSLRPRSISFFAPPDVELFFFVSLRDIPA